MPNGIRALLSNIDIVYLPRNKHNIEKLHNTIEGLLIVEEKPACIVLWPEQMNEATTILETLNDKYPSMLPFDATSVILSSAIYFEINAQDGSLALETLMSLRKALAYGAREIDLIISKETNELLYSAFCNRTLNSELHIKFIEALKICRKEISDVNIPIKLSISALTNDDKFINESDHSLDIGEIYYNLSYNALSCGIDFIKIISSNNIAIDNNLTRFVCKAIKNFKNETEFHKGLILSGPVYDLNILKMQLTLVEVYFGETLSPNKLRICSNGCEKGSLIYRLYDNTESDTSGNIKLEDAIKLSEDGNASDGEIYHFRTKKEISSSHLTLCPPDAHHNSKRKRKFSH